MALFLKSRLTVFQDLAASYAKRKGLYVP